MVYDLPFEDHSFYVYNIEKAIFYLLSKSNYVVFCVHSARNKWFLEALSHMKISFLSGLMQLHTKIHNPTVSNTHSSLPWFPPALSSRHLFINRTAKWRARENCWAIAILSFTIYIVPLFARAWQWDSDIPNMTTET